MSESASPLVGFVGGSIGCRCMRAKSCWVGALVCLLLCSRSAVAQAVDAEATPDPAKVSLSLFEQYRLRIASHVLPDRSPLAQTAAANQNTDQQLHLWADGEVHAYSNHLLGAAQGALYWDLDGTEPAGSPDLFASQTSYQQPWVTPYILSIEWRDEKVLDHIRVGRQASNYGLPLTFDGGSLGLRPLGSPLMLFGFGGRTVHFFESEPGWFESWVASLGAVVRPSSTFKIELDSRLIRERVPDSETAEPITVTNHSYGIVTSARTESLFASARLRGLDRRLSHGGVVFVSDLADLDLGLSASVDAQFVTLSEVAESELPFYSILGRSLPYARYRFETVKRVNVGDLTSLSLSLGWHGRQLLGGRREEPFNRDAGGIYLDTRLDDVAGKGWFVDAMAEYLYVPRAWNRERLLALGGSAGYRGERFRSELGTYYQQFKVRYYERPEELLDSRSIYGSLGYQLFPWLEAQGRYEIEVLDRYLQSFYLSLRQDLEQDL